MAILCYETLWGIQGRVLDSFYTKEYKVLAIKLTFRPLFHPSESKTWCNFVAQEFLWVIWNLNLTDEDCWQKGNNRPTVDSWTGQKAVIFQANNFFPYWFLPFKNWVSTRQYLIKLECLLHEGHKCIMLNSVNIQRTTSNFRYNTWSQLSRRGSVLWLVQVLE